MKAQKGSTAIAVLFLTSTLYDVGGQHQFPAVFAPEMTLYPLRNRKSGAQMPLAGAVNIASTGIRSQTGQAVASRYTDRANRWTYK